MICVRTKVLIGVACLLTLPVLVAPVWGQSTDSGDAPKTESGMTAEELEAYIEKQRVALDVARLEREKQIEKRRQIQAALDEKKKKLADVETEMELLCDERKELDPGNTEPCLADDS